MTRRHDLSEIKLEKGFSVNESLLWLIIRNKNLVILSISKVANIYDNILEHLLSESAACFWCMNLLCRYFRYINALILYCVFNWFSKNFMSWFLQNIDIKCQSNDNVADIMRTKAILLYFTHLPVFSFLSKRKQIQMCISLF